MANSNIKVSSNIMLKERYLKDKGKKMYIPYVLLPDGSRDVRQQHLLTKQQEIQMNRYLFRAKCFKDVYPDE